MDKIDKSFSEKKMKKIENKDEYLQKAKEVTTIVNNGVEKRAFTELTERLDGLQNAGISREQFVFAGNNSSIYRWCIILSCVFLIGYLCFLPVLTGTLRYSDDYDAMASVGIVITVAIVICNIVIVGYMILQIYFKKRYDMYMKVLRFKEIEIIDDLSAYSKIEPNKIIKDLHRAVRLKLIPQGHLCCDDLIFIVSNEVYDQYKKKQVVYDRYYKNLVDERLRMKERTTEMQEILDQGQRYVDKIHESNNVIKDKCISQKLERMENVVSMIFYEVDVNPQYADKLGRFMKYYLPTTEKLLETYIEIDEKNVKGKTLQKTKKEIEGVIDKIIDSFEGLLDKFYQEKELDIATDIYAMEVLMKQDGLTE